MKNLKLFALYCSFFGIYYSIGNINELQIYRLLIVPVGFLILFKGVLRKERVYFYSLLLYLFFLLHPILLFGDISLINILFTFKVLFVLQICIITLDLMKSNEIRSLVKIIVLFMTFNIIVSIHEIVTEKHLSFSNIYNYTQTALATPTGFFFNQNDLAIAFMLTIILINLYLPKSLFSQVNNITNTLFIIIIASRVTVISAIIYFLSKISISGKGISIKKISLVVLSFIVINVGILTGALNQLFTSQEYITGKLKTIDNIGGSRDDLYIYHIKLMIDNPFGMNELSYQYNVFQSGVMNTHSLFIELGQRYGISFLLFTIIIVIYLLLLFIIKKRYNYFVILCILIVLSNVSSSVITGNNYFWVLITIIIYILFKDCKLNHKRILYDEK